MTNKAKWTKSIMIYVCVILGVLMIPFWTLADNPRLPWNISIIEEQDVVDGITSLVIDKEEHYHIAYCVSNAESEGNLRYAYWNGRRWMNETVDDEGSVGWYNDIALKKDNTPCIAYKDGTHGRLKYGCRIQGAWDIQIVDEEQDFGGLGAFVNLEFTPHDSPFLVYADQLNDQLKYAQPGATGWVSDYIEYVGDAGGHHSLRIDSMGVPHIAFWDAYANILKYGRFEGGFWQVEIVDDTAHVGEECALIFDSQNIPHISYYDSDRNALRYATQLSDGFWESTLVAQNAGLSTSICVNEMDQPYIAYLAGTELHLSFKQESGWIHYPIEPVGGWGGYPSMQIRGTEQVVLSYHTDSYAFDGQLKIAKTRL